MIFYKHFNLIDIDVYIVVKCMLYTYFVYILFVVTRGGHVYFELRTIKIQVM